MAKRRQKTSAIATGKRGTFITPRAAVSRTLKTGYWPETHLAPLLQRVVKSYTYTLPNYRERQRPLATGQLTRRPRRPVSGMHDTYFKRPAIAPYQAWAKGAVAYLSPNVKTCMQRKIRREAVFATTGGGSIRRKSTNRRDLRSQIRCK